MLTTLLALAACASAPAEQPAPGPPPETIVAAPAPRAASTAPSPTVEAAVLAAKKYIGHHYEWAGRDTAKNPGIDCLGLLYLGFGEATGTPWRRYPVNPSQLVGSGLLGGPVPGLDGVLRAEIEWSKLRRGDVLYFLMEGYEIKDTPLWVDAQGARYWPWHTGLYLDEGRDLALHASPSAGVTEQPLDEIAFDALFVTRFP